MKEEDLVDYLLVRDLFFFKVVRRHTRQHVLTADDVHYEDSERMNSIGVGWMYFGNNPLEEWFLMHKGADILLKQWMTRLPSDTLLLSDPVYSHRNRDFYTLAEREFFRSLDAAATARARHYCKQFKVYLRKFGDAELFEIAKALFYTLGDELVKEVVSRMLRKIASPKKKTRQLESTIKQASRTTRRCHSLCS